VERLEPVSAFFSVIVTPGSTPPVTSVTVPERSNRVTSARRLVATASRKTKPVTKVRTAVRGMASDYRGGLAEGQATAGRRLDGARALTLGSNGIAVEKRVE